MSLTVLAIGYVLLAVAELAPKFIKDENKASTVAFFCAFISLILFVSSLVNNTYFNQ